MKSINLALAGLIAIGTIGASGSTAAAAIEDSISSAEIAEITRTIKIRDIQFNISGIINDDIQADLIDANILISRDILIGADISKIAA
jgi:hypothetical protein